jgi:Putative Ig domain
MVIRTWKFCAVAAIAAATLSGCKWEKDSPSVADATPGSVSIQSAPNIVPTLSGTPGTTIKAGTTYLFQALAVDGDGDALKFSATGLPAWATLNVQTGQLSGTPAEGDVGITADIVISVSDGESSVSLPAFRISIASALPPPVTPPTATNRAPSISGAPATRATATQSYSFTPAATDPDANVLTFSIANRPSWAAFNTATGRMTGTPSISQARTYGNIVITVSDGALSASLPTFSITVTAPANRAPAISGSPGTSVTAGTAYSFTPTASDADGNTLAFAISGKPGWATFSTATGALTGTPGTTQTGVYSGIVISVSDGTSTTLLPAFSITVSQPTATGTATLSWSAPTQNTDGSALTDLAGYRVHHGTSASTLTDVVDVPGASAAGYTWKQLAAGTHYFAVSAYTAGGVESSMSAMGSKVIQ